MVDTEYITKSAGLENYGWPEPDVITDGEVLEFERDDPRAYMGIEPSGKPHLGHAMQIERLNRAEEAGFDTYILIADLHAYKNGKPEGVDDDERRKEEIKQLSEEIERSLDPLCNTGIDFVYGSDFQTDEGYDEIVEKLKNKVPAKRAKKAVGEVASEGQISVAQLEYPLMQVADMYYFGEEGKPVDLAMGGTDQRKIHALARDYPPSGLSKVDSVHYPLIGNHLTSQKMSKDKDPIFVEDSKQLIREKTNNLYFPTDLETISNEFDLNDWEPIQEENKLEEAMIKTSVPLQLAAELVFAKGNRFEIERSPDFGGDVTYEDPEKLLEDTAEGQLHPADIKENVARVVNEILNP